MADVRRTDLPGIGYRAELNTSGGTPICVVVHRSGKRDLLVFGRGDPDAPRDAVNLQEDEARTLAELLGGAHVSESVTKAVQLPGLVIDWVDVPDDSPVAGRSLSDIGVHTRTGASVVAIIRSGDTVIAPGADDVVRGGDTVVIVTDEAGASRFNELLRAG